MSCSVPSSALNWQKLTLCQMAKNFYGVQLQYHKTEKIWGSFGAKKQYIDNGHSLHPRLFSFNTNDLHTLNFHKTTWQLYIFTHQNKATFISEEILILFPKWGDRKSHCIQHCYIYIANFLKFTVPLTVLLPKDYLINITYNDLYKSITVKRRKWLIYTNKHTHRIRRFSINLTIGLGSTQRQYVDDWNHDHGQSFVLFTLHLKILFFIHILILVAVLCFLVLTH